MAKLDSLKVQRLLKARQPVMAADGGGLYLRIRDTGSATWTFRYRYAGKDVWMPLGDARDMSLGTAREDARAARVLIDRGTNPLAEKRQAEAEAQRQGPFKELADRWYKSEIKPRLQNPDIVWRALENHVLPKLGKKNAQDVTPGDCAAVLDAVRHDYPALANDLLRYLRALFAFARRRHLINTSPVADFSTRLDAGGTEKSRDRALDRTEIATLLKAIRESETFGRENALAIKLLLALCVRKGELLAAEWDEFDLDGADKKVGPVWRLPVERSKTGAGIDIPLPPPAVEWLHMLKGAALGSPYVFPARRKDSRARYDHVGLDTLNVALDRLEHDLEAFTLHDLRRTARTQLAALGVRSEVAERCLNHKLKGVEGTYNQHDYFQERRDALTTWAALIVELDQEGDQNKVVPIRAKTRK